MSNAQISFHPLADIFPLLEGDAYFALVEDIRTHGLNEPVVLFDGKVLDGRNRVRACNDADEPVRTVDLACDDPLAFVLGANLHRRHLTEGQKAMLAVDIANMRQGERTDLASREARLISQDETADRVGVSRSSVQRAAIVKAAAIPEIVEAVKQGHMPVKQAALVARLSLPRQRQVAAEMRSGKSLSTIVLAATRRERVEAIDFNSLCCPLSALGRLFPVLLADPPWHVEAWSEGGMSKAAEMHYPTMPTVDIGALKVADIAARDAVLFMWALANMLPEALEVVKAWGFKFCTSAVWVKPNLACGHWFRGHHEPLIVATRGDMPPPPELHSSVFEGARSGPHSGKPDIVRDWIASAYPDAGKIELFARTAAPGWTAWGNQAPVE